MNVMDNSRQGYINSFITHVQAYQAHNAAEQTHKLHFLHALKTVPEIFDRSCFAPGHITVTAWVVNPGFTKLYLIKHTVIGLVMPAGGHVDNRVILYLEVVKEAWEELGIKLTDDITFNGSQFFDLDTHQVKANPAKGEPEHLHFNVGFLFIYDDSQPMPPSPEGIETGWFTFEEAETHFPFEGGRYRCLQKIKKLRKREPSGETP